MILKVKMQRINSRKMKAKMIKRKFNMKTMRWIKEKIRMKISKKIKSQNNHKKRSWNLHNFWKKWATLWTVPFQYSKKYSGAKKYLLMIPMKRNRKMTRFSLLKTLMKLKFLMCQMIKIVTLFFDKKIYH